MTSTRNSAAKITAKNSSHKGGRSGETKRSKRVQSTRYCLRMKGGRRVYVYRPMVYTIAGYRAFVARWLRSPAAEMWRKSTSRHVSLLGSEPVTMFEGRMAPAA